MTPAPKIQFNTTSQKLSQFLVTVNFAVNKSHKIRVLGQKVTIRPLMFLKSSTCNIDVICNIKKCENCFSPVVVLSKRLLQLLSIKKMHLEFNGKGPLVITLKINGIKNFGEKKPTSCSVKHVEEYFDSKKCGCVERC